MCKTWLGIEHYKKTIWVVCTYVPGCFSFFLSYFSFILSFFLSSCLCFFTNKGPPGPPGPPGRPGMFNCPKGVSNTFNTPAPCCPLVCPILLPCLPLSLFFKHSHWDDYSSYCILFHTVCFSPPEDSVSGPSTTALQKRRKWSRVRTGIPKPVMLSKPHPPRLPWCVLLTLISICRCGLVGVYFTSTNTLHVQIPGDSHSGWLRFGLDPIMV